MESIFKFFLGKLIFLVFLGLIAYIVVFKENIVSEFTKYQQSSKELVITKAEVKTPNKLVFVNKVDIEPSPKATLNTARLLFLDKNYSASINEYKRLIKTNKSNVDYHGELANVLYGTGLIDEAVKEFYLTAELLIEQNDLFRVQRIQNVLSTLDEEKSKKILKDITNARGINKEL